MKEKLEAIRKKILAWRRDDSQLYEAACDLLNEIEQELKQLIKECAK